MLTVHAVTTKVFSFKAFKIALPYLLIEILVIKKIIEQRENKNK